MDYVWKIHSGNTQVFGENQLMAHTEQLDPGSTSILTKYFNILKGTQTIVPREQNKLMALLPKTAAYKEDLAEIRELTRQLASAEVNLRASEAKYKALYQEALDQNKIISRLLKRQQLTADNVEGFSLWQKDINNRYINANKVLRNTLFDGLSEEQVLGKTDEELIFGTTQGYNFLERIDFASLTPDTLPLIKPENIEDDDFSKICCLTDEITKTFAKPCKFFEAKIENGKFIYALIAWKTPIFENGKCIGTTGAARDILAQADKYLAQIQRKVISGQAHRIDNTNNYYLMRY